MSGSKLCQVDVKGFTFQVYVTSQGEFYAEHAGQTVSSESLKGLRERLRASVKAADPAVNVPFWVIDKETNRVKEGVATGIHGGTGNVILKWGDGTRTQTRGYGEEFHHPVGEDVIKELNEALAARREAEETIARISAAARFPLRSHVRNQLVGRPPEQSPGEEAS